MPSDSARVEATTRVWAVIGARLEEFARAWEAGDPPDPARFLPDGPPAVRRLTLVELVKLDIDYRLARGLAKPVEEYVAEFPELAADGPPCDLLYEDYQLRQRAGLAARPEDYFRRFPGRAAELARLLGGTDPARSTSVFAARAPLAVGPGDQLDEFDLLTQLGEGQFAKVFLARQRGMQRLVALKVSARKAAEAQTLARLDHPHVVRVYDQRYLADRGVQLVYMSYLPGGTLLDVLHHARTVPPERRSGRTLLEAVDAALDRRGEVPPATSPARQHWAGLSWPATVCELGAKLAAALDYAHRRGVLHRDVKPANVLLTAEGEPQLADFNVGYCSKVEGAGPADFFGGTLGYMAPEHLEAFNPGHPRPPESLDGRADVYGLAVTLWELLTGSRPFGHDELLDSWEETLAAIAERRRAGPPPAAVAALPEGDVLGLREVLVRCLDPDPARRPATAGEMARELELCLRPATRDLVRPRPGGWREAVRRHPLLTAYPAGLAPNVLASLFNIAYNRKEIIDPWPAAHAVFDTVMLAVNGFFFPLGMLLFAVAIWPVMRGLRRAGRQRRPLAERADYITAPWQRTTKPGRGDPAAAAGAAARGDGGRHLRRLLAGGGGDLAGGAAGGGRPAAAGTGGVPALRRLAGGLRADRGGVPVLRRHLPGRPRALPGAAGSGGAGSGRRPGARAGGAGVGLVPGGGGGGAAGGGGGAGLAGRDQPVRRGGAERHRPGRHAAGVRARGPHPRRPGRPRRRAPRPGRVTAHPGLRRQRTGRRAVFHLTGGQGPATV